MPLNSVDIHLLEAVRKGDIADVERRLSEGANMNAVDGDGSTPLIEATSKGDNITLNENRKHIARLLIEKGADVNAATKKGDTPLIQAAKAGFNEIAELLLDKGANINHTNKSGSTALYAAVVEENLVLVKKLLKRKANIDTQNKDGITPLMYATQYGYNAIVCEILKEKPNLDYQNKNGDTALMLACRNEHILTVKRLLKGINKNIIHICNHKHQTALSIAMETGNVDLIKLLIENGADVNTLRHNGETLLSFFIQKGDVKMVERLLAHGADPNLAKADKPTPLIHAITSHSDETLVEKLCAMLLVKGARVRQATSQYRTTALSYAMRKNFNRMARILIYKGAHLKGLSYDALTEIHNWTKRNANAAGIQAVCHAKLGYSSDLKKITCHFGRKLLENEANANKAEVEPKRNEQLLPLRGNPSKTTKKADARPTSMNKDAPDEKSETTFNDLNTDVLGRIAFYALFDANKNPTGTYKSLSRTSKALHDVTASPASLFNISHRQVLQGNQKVDGKFCKGRHREHLQYPLIKAARAGSKSHVEELLRLGANPNTHDRWNDTPLHWLCHASEEHVDIASLLIQYGADVNARDSCETTPLGLAAARGHENIVSLLIKHHVQVDYKHSDGSTVLNQLILGLSQTPSLNTDVIDRYTRIAKMLIDNKAPVNAQDKVGITPLILAAKYGYTDIVKTLLDNGALRNLATHKGNTALSLALQHGHADVVKLFISDNKTNIPYIQSNAPTLLLDAAKANNQSMIDLLLENIVDIRSNLAGRAFIVAIENGHIELAKHLILQGVDLSVTNTYGHTALTLALEKGSLDLVNCLLEHGADLTKVKNPLTKAINQADIDFELIETLLRNGADINETSTWGGVGLSRAIERGRWDVVVYLVQQGADLHKVEGPLHIAINKGHLTAESLEMLIQHGVDVNALNKQSTSALETAINLGRLDIVNLLLEHGADLKQVKHPLIKALQAKIIDIALVKRLLQHGADVNEQESTSGSDQLTPLDLAIRLGNEAIVRLLLQNGAKLDQAHYPLTHAIQSENANVALVKLLIEHNADVNEQNITGTSALSTSFIVGKPDITDLLLEHKADVNTPNNSGDTPLHFACRSKHILGAKTLIQRGADVNQSNVNGTTPLMCIPNRRRTLEIEVALAELLLESRANLHTKDRCGATALISAMSENNYDLVSTLIHHGAHLKDLSEAQLKVVSDWANTSHNDVYDIYLFANLKRKGSPRYESDWCPEAELPISICGSIIIGGFLALAACNPAGIPIVAAAIIIGVLSLLISLIITAVVHDATDGLRQRSKDKKEVKRSTSPLLKKLIENEKAATLKEKAAHKVGCVDKTEAETVRIAETVLTSETVTLDTSTANDTASTTEKTTESRPEENVETTLNFPDAAASMHHR